MTQNVGKFVVYLKKFEDPHAAFVAGVVALHAACAAPEAGLLQKTVAFRDGAQPDGFVSIRGMRFGAVGADLAYQALRQHRVQRGGNQITGGAHVDQAVGGADRVVGVQGRQNQVTSHGGAQTDLGGFLIAHLANQDDVRVLPQGGAQHTGEGEVDLEVDLHLVDARQAVFHRIFDGDDFFAGVVEFGQHGVEGGRFAAAGWASDQHHAVGFAHDPPQPSQDVWRHAHVVQPENALRLIEQAHYHGFAVNGWHGGQTHIHAAVAHPHVEAPVLWHAAFGDVEAAHELESGYHR